MDALKYNGVSFNAKWAADKSVKEFIAAPEHDHLFPELSKPEKEKALQDVHKRATEMFKKPETPAAEPVAPAQGTNGTKGA